MEMKESQAAPSPTVEDLMIYDQIFKRSLKCKCLALIFCITGTVLMFLVPIDFYSSQAMTMLMPCFVFGYIFVHVAGVLTACRGHIYLIADIIFSSVSCVGNLASGIYVLYFWIDSIVETYALGNQIEGTMFIVLSISCLLHAMAMGGQLAASLLELRRRVVSGAGANEH